MNQYTPSFTISLRMMALACSISEKAGRIAVDRAMFRGPHLRRNSSIESIHASLRIEANSLSLSEVRDVINGREVIGDAREIREVRNGYAAYACMDSIDPYNLDDLKRIHCIMTEGLVLESGEFRMGDEGVFAGDACVFIARRHTWCRSSWRTCSNG